MKRPTEAEETTSGGDGGEDAGKSSNKGLAIGVSVAVVIVVIGVGIGIFIFVRKRRGRLDRREYLEKEEDLVEEAAEHVNDEEVQEPAAGEEANADEAISWGAW
jgi:uncharacterized protein HemX